MLIFETIFDGGKPLGRIYRDTDSGIFHFAPSDPGDSALAAIASKTWECPVKLRNAIIEELESKQA